MNQTLAIKTKRDYVCSVCWAPLEMYRTDAGEWDCTCTRYGTEHKGYHHRKYVERREQESMGELMDARHTLKDTGLYTNPHKGKTAQELLKELGF